MKDTVVPRRIAVFDARRWYWHLRRWHRRVGTAGAMAAIVCLAIVLIQCAWMHPRLTREQTRLAALRQSLATAGPAQAVNAFASVQASEARLQTVFAVLSQHHLTSREARYHPSRGQPSAAEPGVVLELPIDGRYLDARAALAALEALPGVRVERFSMRRDALHAQRLAMTLRIAIIRGEPR